MDRQERRERGLQEDDEGPEAPQDLSLAGKVVVVTGASSGFGKGATFALAREGAAVVAAARRDELLQDVVTHCQRAGFEAMAVHTDVSKAAEVEELLRRAIGRHGRIDVWINNAGVGALGPFERIPLADHVQVVETNLLGTLYGSYYAYRRFLEQGFGTLINIASELGSHTVPYYSSYTAAKHGVVGLSACLRQELELRELADIHVCTVLPTAHDTPFFEHAANYTGHEVKPPEPLHDPAEVVDAIVALARDPQDTKIVGSDGVLKVLMQKLVPGLSEKLGARSMHKTQMVDAPPGEDSPGALHAPMDEGIRIRGDRE
jgi:NAD(P)-dependent dehydrogenase (short-subunit alcohol dehydrogenase family)